MFFSPEQHALHALQVNRRSGWKDAGRTNEFYGASLASISRRSYLEPGCEDKELMSITGWERHVEQRGGGSGAATASTRTGSYVPHA